MWMVAPKGVGLLVIMWRFVSNVRVHSCNPTHMKQVNAHPSGAQEGHTVSVLLLRTRAQRHVPKNLVSLVPAARECKGGGYMYDSATCNGATGSLELFSAVTAVVMSCSTE